MPRIFLAAGVVERQAKREDSTREAPEIVVIGNPVDLRIRISLTLFLAMIAWVVAPTAQTDPSDGTWELNIAKSKYSPGPGPKSNTVVIQVAGDVVTVTTKGVAPDGSPTSSSYSSKLDGSDTPVKLTGPQDYDTIALKRINATRVEGTRKLEGKVVQTYTSEVSNDGKTMTVTTTGTNAKGEKVNNVAVSEKNS